MGIPAIGGYLRILRERAGKLPEAVMNGQRIEMLISETFADSITNITRKAGNKIIKPLTELVITETKLQEYAARIYISLNGERLGIIKCEVKQKDLMIERGYYITELASYKGDEYKGIGNALFDNMFKHSYAVGENGNLRIQAFNKSNIEAHCNKEGITPSPIGFLRKCGFIADAEYVEMAQVRKVTQGLYLGNSPTLMHLPKNTILEIKKRLNIQ